MLPTKFSSLLFLTLISCYCSYTHTQAVPSIAQELVNVATRLQASQAAQAAALATAQAATKAAAAPDMLKGLEMVTRATLKFGGSCCIQALKHPAFSILAFATLLCVSSRFRQFTSKCLSASFNAIARIFPQSLFVTTIQALQRSWYNLNPTREERAQAEQSLNEAAQRQEKVAADQQRLTGNVRELSSQVQSLQQQLQATTKDLEEARAHRTSFGELESTVKVMSASLAESQQTFPSLLKALAHSVSTQESQVNSLTEQLIGVGKSLETHRSITVAQMQEIFNKHQESLTEREQRITSSNQLVLCEIAATRSKHENLQRSLKDISSLIQQRQAAATSQDRGMFDVQ